MTDTGPDEKPTLKDIVIELQDRILEKHGSEVGYKLTAQAGETAINLEVYVPRAYNGTSPQPDPQPQPLTVEHVKDFLKGKGINGNLKVETLDGDLVIKKTRKLPDDTWNVVNQAVKVMGFRWVSFDEANKSTTGLWRIPS